MVKMVPGSQEGIGQRGGGSGQNDRMTNSEWALSCTRQEAMRRLTGPRRSSNREGVFC